VLHNIVIFAAEYKTQIMASMADIVDNLLVTSVLFHL